MVAAKLSNHVIHLERHWNPAKEAQATDRVYRISQTRHVLVHVPILLHPERAAYDVNLDRLLRSKMRLQDALTITAPEEVTADEVLKGMFGGQDGAGSGAVKLTPPNADDGFSTPGEGGEQGGEFDGHDGGRGVA